MKRLLIMGAGGFGREVLQWANHINSKKRWDLIGFLDDDLNALVGKKSNAEIIASDGDFAIEPNDEFICAIGDCNVRKKAMRAMIDRGAKFINIIHPTAIIADTAVLGKGIVVCPYTVISANVEIGDGCIFNAHASIGHDVKIGEFCTVNSYCNITGECKISDCVYMGTSAHLVPGVAIGKNAFICAGSTVVTKVKSNTKVFGNPAVRIDI